MTISIGYTYEGYCRSSSLAEGRSYASAVTFDDGYSVTRSGCYYRFSKDKVGIANMAFNGMYYWVEIGQEGIETRAEKLTTNGLSPIEAWNQAYRESRDQRVKLLHEELQGRFPLLAQLMGRFALVPPGPQEGRCTGTITI